MVGPDITSTANPRIKRLIALRNRRDRDRESVFVVEGETLIGRAVAAGHRPLELYYQPGRFQPDPEWPGEVVAVTGEVLDRASYRSRSEGVLAVFPQFPVSLDRVHLPDRPLVLVVEGIEKPGNLGAILRTADAAGADLVVASDPGTDLFNPNVIRASTGAVFTVPVAVTDLGAAVDALHRAGVRLVAAQPGSSTSYWSTDLTQGCAVLIGAEHEGLSDAARAAADLTVSVPMSGQVDSLNASVSAALIVFEAVRQRRAKLA